jgi:hypothetical protein
MEVKMPSALPEMATSPPCAPRFKFPQEMPHFDSEQRGYLDGNVHR